MSGAQGKIIQAIRKAHGLTLRAMAKSVGYSHTYLSDVETGKLPLTPGLLSAVMRHNLHRKVGKGLLKAAGKCPACFGTGEVKSGR